MTDRLKVWFCLQDFASHERVGADYQAIISALCERTDDPTQADIAYIHQEPHNYLTLMREVPALRHTYVVGYAVWEAQPLPALFVKGIALTDEIWTASAYCHAMFHAAHDNVHWIPHIVQRPGTVTAADRALVQRWLGLRDGDFYYLTITREGFARKNTPCLLNAFAYVNRRVPSTRLIVKTADTTRGPQQAPRVRRYGNTWVVHGDVTEGVMNALYERADAYVSAHTAEGWGLTLSDAMLLNTPVIATAHSGNMDFMTPQNSFLVGFHEETVRHAERNKLCKPPMRRAYPHREALECQMLRAYAMQQDGTLAHVATQARRDIGCYDAAHVAPLIKARLEVIAHTIKTQPHRGKRR